MEAEWMKSIKNSTICTFFYWFYVVYAVIFALAVISLVVILFNFKKLGAAGLALGFQAVLMTAVGAALTLSYYLMCDRALLSGAVKEVQEKFMNH